MHYDCLFAEFNSNEKSIGIVHIMLLHLPMMISFIPRSEPARCHHRSQSKSTNLRIVASLDIGMRGQGCVLVYLRLPTNLYAIFATARGEKSSSKTRENFFNKLHIGRLECGSGVCLLSLREAQIGCYLVWAVDFSPKSHAFVKLLPRFIVDFGNVLVRSAGLFFCLSRRSSFTMIFFITFNVFISFYSSAYILVLAQSLSLRTKSMFKYINKILAMKFSSLVFGIFFFKEIDGLI